MTRANTPLYWNSQQREGDTSPVGAFADPTFPPPTFSVYEARKHGWVTLPAGTTHCTSCDSDFG